MRTMRAACLALGLVGCHAALVIPEKAESPEELLLSSSASDFQKHAPHPAKFRDVHLTYFLTPEGSKQLRLCGEFLPSQEKGQATWTQFATVKTSGYEQWLGAQAIGMCQGMPRVNDKDLTETLQTRFLGG